MARFLLMLVCVALVVVWLSTIQGVNSKCANHCKERCDEIHRRQRLSRLPCYIRCRKLAATCKSCSGPRWCFKCSPGYLLTTEPRCVFNKCRKNNGGCDADATCSNFLNRLGGISYTCECNNGYSGDGKSCTDVDECQTNNGGCRRNGDVSATCSNTIGSFTCSCSDGFTEKGTSCIDKNECLSNHGGCRDNGDTKAVCVNNRGSFTCKCGIGFVSAGTSCNDVNECLQQPAVCQAKGDARATCRNDIGTFTCTCSSSGFAGALCEDVNECLQQPNVCTVKGDAKATCTNNNGTFTCTCSSGFTGLLCQDINECETNNGGCRADGDTSAMCENSPGSFTCTCSTGFTFNGTLCKDKDECETNNGGCSANGDTNAVCVNNPGSFTCNCSANFIFLFGTSCYGLNPTLIQTITYGDSVTSVTVHGGYLYVASNGLSTNQIVVYDATTFQVIRYITIQDSGELSGMVVSADNANLFVTDLNNDCVYKVDLSSDTFIRFPVGSYPVEIIINRQGNLMLTTYSGNLEEYTTDGVLVRKIIDGNLLGGVAELSDGSFAVSRPGAATGVAVYSSDGTFKYDSGSVTFSWAYALSADSRDYMLVVDSFLNQVFVLNPTLSAVRTLSLPLDKNSGPAVIFLDESRGVLIVGEYFPPFNLLVFSNVYNLASLFAV